MDLSVVRDVFLPLTKIVFPSSLDFSKSIFFRRNGTVIVITEPKQPSKNLYIALELQVTSISIVGDSATLRYKLFTIWVFFAFSF